ncbi:pancreatic triacylglycerol lipase-like [Bacillus rossius redtenbacheri]|uniref:pancreatic triacylglycerol lipase-like n=1 Tax=Bacillus rossius redtenbacheri TaxID=93214 RepID=UPI002FDF0364
MAAGDDYNVIEVDWSAGASALYPVARGHVVEVGARVAKLLDALVASGLSSARLHLIGHSLGAHIAGVAANRFRGKVARVTGLDPAGPLFGVGESAADRLDSSDAGFVDVIHTCAGVLGWKNPIGHADFFPNGGGMVQPGCNNDMAELGLGSCSHTRSHKYFEESITTRTGFVGKQCANWATYKSGKCAHNAHALMGEKVSTSAKGTYFLATRSSAPFAEG